MVSIIVHVYVYIGYGLAQGTYVHSRPEARLSGFGDDLALLFGVAHNFFSPSSSILLVLARTDSMQILEPEA